MAGIQDQAAAIWKTLDQMLENDPEGYEKFIAEQMESSKQFFAAQKSGKKGIEEMVKFEELCKINPAVNTNIGNKKNSQTTLTTSKPSKTDLTDNAFSMTSLLATICPENVKEESKGQGDSEDFILEDLKIPGQKKSKENRSRKRG